ncbi:MAG: hypothetical protein KJZ79_08245 [Bryobacteraceae bacterium]|nr:hypothetical protein [Bryobacteraceae bacterium]
MPVTVKSVAEAFELLYTSLLSRDFSKSLRLHEWGEQKLLPLVRTFLLGYFGESAVPEAGVVLPGALTGRGRVDFIVSNVAVEFVVRRPNAPRATLSQLVNASEVKKLMKFNGPALLVMYDFSATPLSREDLARFRKWPSLGRGWHKKSPFNLVYFSRPTQQSSGCETIRMNIRVS